MKKVKVGSEVPKVSGTEGIKNPIICPENGQIRSSKLKSAKPLTVKQILQRMHAMKGVNIDIENDKHMRVDRFPILPSEQCSPENTLKCDILPINMKEHNIRSDIDNIPTCHYDFNPVNPDKKGGGFKFH